MQLWQEQSPSCERLPVGLGVPGATNDGILLLQIRSGSRLRERAIQTDALLGRRDPRQGVNPQVAFNLDDAVSRRHAIISRRGGRFFLKDLGSTNGTRYNGAVLDEDEEVPLSTDDEIEIGAFTRIRVLRAPAEGVSAPIFVGAGAAASMPTGSVTPPEPSALQRSSVAARVAAAAPEGRAYDWSPAAASPALAAWDLPRPSGPTPALRPPAPTLPAAAAVPAYQPQPFASPVASPETTPPAGWTPFAQTAGIHAATERKPDAPTDGSFGWDPLGWHPLPADDN